MHFDFVFLRRSDIFFANQTLEGIGSRDAVDRNERAFGESRRDASDATDDDGTHAGNDRGFVSEKGMKMEGILDGEKRGGKLRERKPTNK